MQGTAAALSEKILRKENCLLAGNSSEEIKLSNLSDSELNEFSDKVEVVDAFGFRTEVQQRIIAGKTWFHEGSQGYALSIDHGSHYPYCTSRNCTTQKAMDDMGIPPSMMGDVYLNLRTRPIRVGNVVEEGEQKGYSGDFYPDCQELTWQQVGELAGMPPDEIQKLSERERTTVTKRIRRVSTFSWIGLKDAAITNGATKICINFIQYLNWKDSGIKGDKKALEKLSKESRGFIDKVEEVSGVPVVLIGTGPKHDEVINLL
jgi:adenylosuccinate synthase